MKPKVPAVPRAVVRSVMALYVAAQRAAERLLPADIALFMHIAGFWQTGLVSAAAALRIADHLVDGAKSAAELAQIAHADADAVHRTMRALVAQGVFALDGDRFCNNRLSEYLRSDVDGSMRAAADHFGSKANLEAWADFVTTVRTGKSAFARVHGASIWDFYTKHPADGEAFAEFMATETELMAPAVVAAYSFRNLARICDVAGGRGPLLAEVLRSNPAARGVLFDDARVLALAPSYLTSRGVNERVERIAGSFFESVPEGCDAYLMKDILHDWDDARALKILGNCRRSMKPHARLLIVETMVEPFQTDMVGPLTDVHMMTVCDDGRQRSTADFKRLFAQSGLRLERVVPTAYPPSVIEAVAI